MPKATVWHPVMVLTIVTAVSFAVMLRPPISQDPAYHAFADGRLMAGIPNAFDVLSNAAFAAVGIWGLTRLRRPRRTFDWWGRFSFYASLILVSAGSAYYHLAPENTRLFWDRLPMTFGFMSVVALLIAERISPRAGSSLFLPLLALGASSAVYWRWTESAGHGDLRPYVIVQVLPLILIPLLVLGSPARGPRNSLWLLAAGSYGLAKLAESLDAAILQASSLVSGHTLKHLFAALACFLLLRALELPRRS